MSRLLFAAHDLGGAQMIAPVCAHLRRAGHNLFFGAAGPAASFWRELGFDVIAHPSDAEDLAETILQVQPDLLVTGTSYKSDLERSLWLAAQDRGIASIAVIDSTMNLQRRLQFVSRTGSSFPTHAAVVTAECRNHLARTGIPPERCHVVGQPHLEQFVVRLAPKRAQHTRDTPPVFTFYSEPIFQDEPGPLSPGYDQFSVFEQLTRALGFDHEIEIRVRPHPREDPEDWSIALSEVGRYTGCTVKLDRRAHGDALVYSDAAIGMTSMALVESALLGVPILAIQPQRTRIDNPLLDQFRHACQVLTDDDIKAGVDDLVSQVGGAKPPLDPFGRIIEDSTQRLRQTIEIVARQTGNN